MLYLFAAVGVVTIAVLLWRMLGEERVGATAPRTPTAPDDDPEFLRRLAEENKRDDGDQGRGRSPS
ncbi:MAG: hypothetical protein ACRDQ5_01505 [Sciscionella sp.]